MIVVVALLASFLIKTFLIRSFFIPSASMEDTLLGEPGHHDRILVDELVPHLVPLQRGDVVVFKDPGGWLEGQEVPQTSKRSPIVAVLDRALSFVGFSTEDSSGYLVKRVIGLPGDRVTCCDALGRMSVDGVPLHEPYVHLEAGSGAASRDPFTATVPAGGVWVMGDNRDDSLDSRFHTATALHGSVPIRDVVGRAVVISWPVARWRWLTDYPGTFAGVR